MNEPPAILILAASLYQIPFIQRARELGFRVVTLDNRPDNPGHRLADTSICASTTDPAAVLAAARAEKVSAILAPCTDVALPSAARAAADLGLPFPSPPAVDTLTSKAAFRRFQQSRQLPHPDFVEVRSGKPLPVWPTWPALVKPDRASGAKGMRMVTDLDDLKEACCYAAPVSLNGTVVIEAFLPGKQTTLEGIWDGQRWIASWLFDRVVAPPPYTTTMGHNYPSCQPTSLADKARQAVAAILTHFAIPPTFVDADLVFTPEGPIILEMAPRVGGNSITRFLAALAGVDVPDLTIRLATGQSLPSLPAPPFPAGALRLLGSATPGILYYEPDAVAHWRKQSGVAVLDIDLPPHTPVPVMTDSRNRLGEIITTGPDLETAVSRIDQILRNIQWEVSS